MLHIVQNALNVPFSGFGQAFGFLLGNPWIRKLELNTVLSQMSPMLRQGVYSATNPLTMLHLIQEANQRLNSTASLFWNPAATAVSAIEMRNKVEIFLLVLAITDVLDLPKEGPIDLDTFVNRAYSMDHFSSLWAVEGLGRAYGTRFFQQGMTPKGILRQENTAYLPSKALLMLHAGIGMSFAKHTFLQTTAHTPHTEIRRQVHRIIQLCEDNSRPGYVIPAYEALGLVVRTFNPDLQTIVDTILKEDAPHLRGYFWHGCGRALYFRLINWPPCSITRVFEQAEAESHDDPSLRSAYAGAALAFLMVNQRNPEVLDELLIQPYGEHLSKNPGFINGIASAAIMRRDTTPDAAVIASFAAYQPKGNATSKAHWQHLIAQPYEIAIHRLYPTLVRENRLGDIFRFREQKH